MLYKKITPSFVLKILMIYTVYKHIILYLMYINTGEAELSIKIVYKFVL